MGPTLVWYLLGAAVTAEEPTTALPLSAARATAAAGAAGGVAATGAIGGAAAGEAGLEPEARAGEERRTHGRKALPPRVFTILEPEKEKKGEGGFRNWKLDVKWKGKKEKGFI